MNLSAFQIVENLGGSQIFTLFLILNQLEIELEILVYRLSHLKLAVVLHDQLHLFRIKITLLAIVQSGQRLGEKLLIVRTHTHIDWFRQFHSDESSVAGWVGENIRDVARGDERGETRKFHDMTTIRRLVFQRRQLDEVLQESLLHLWRNLVELIEIDNHKLRHRLINLTFF